MYPAKLSQEYKLNSLKILFSKNDEVSFSYDKNKIEIEEIIKLIQKDKVKILDIFTDDGDLEDIFLRLTKN